MLELPTYSEVQAHGAALRTFTCEVYRAQLTVPGCAKRWHAGQGDKPSEAFDTCGRCPLGALHAGRPHVMVSPHYGTDLCPRCDRGGLRLIQGRVCVSCYNREGEVSKGKNARGNRPARARQLHPVRLVLVVDNTPRPVEDEATRLSEVMCRTIRNTKGGVTFGARYRALAAMQLELRFA